MSFFLDDDDVLLPEYIRKTLDVLAMAGRDTEFGFSAAICGKKVIGNKRTTGELAPDVALRDRLAGLGMGFGIKLSTLRALGGLDEAIFVNEDTDLCLRLPTTRDHRREGAKRTQSDGAMLQAMGIVALRMEVPPTDLALEIARYVGRSP